MMITAEILASLTEEQRIKVLIEETDRILKDPIYFIETYIKCVDAKTGKLIPFILYKYQKRAVKKFMKRKRCLTMKSRQTGLTTVTQAFMAWVMITKDNQICKVISNRMKISSKFLGGVRQMIDNARMETGKLFVTSMGKRKYKSWIIPEYSMSLNAKEAFALSNDSTIIAEGNTPEAGRGDTINWLVIDEVAAIDYQKKQAMEDIWASAGPALTRSGGTCIAISCVTKDTFIYTNKGIQQIEDFIPEHIKDTSYKQDIELEEEYFVRGKDKLRNSNLFCINGMGKTRNLITRYAELEGSLKHKGWVYSDNEYKIQEFQNLKINDWVNIQSGMNCWGDDDYIGGFKVSDKHKFSSNLNGINIPEYLTPDWCYLFGLYISEGCATKIYSKDNNSIIGGTITITCGDDITKIFNDLGLKYSSSDNIHYTISSKQLIELMEYIGFDITNKANSKKIPKRLLSINKNNMIGLLQGIFDGDGTASKKRVAYTSTSEVLIKQIRAILLNFGILSYKFKVTKEKMNSYKENIDCKYKHFGNFNYDSHILEMTTNYAIKFQEEIGFRLERKKHNTKFNYSFSHLPNSKEILQNIIKQAGKGYSIDTLRNKYKIKVSYKNNYTKENIEKVLESLFTLKPSLKENEYIKYVQDRILIPNSVWVPITKIEELENETFDVSLPQTDDFWCHSVIYNGILQEQTPKGKRGWYFDQYVDAEKKGWDIIEAPWVENPMYNLGMYQWIKDPEDPNKGELLVLNEEWPDVTHPDDLLKYKTRETYQWIKDGKIRSPWYDVESRSLGPNRTACELDCSFSGSGGECLDSDVINNHKLMCIEAMRKGQVGIMKNYYTFKEYVKGREYLIIVDIATGDGSDSSAIIVFDVEAMEVVATYKDDKVTPDNLAYVVYDIAREYGTPMVVIENNGPGLTCLLKMQNDLMYDNAKIYRSKLKKKDPNERDGKKSKLGFWQSNETRSLGGNTLEEWLNTYKIKINDKRIQKELETWVWLDGRRDHLPDKHDDLIMALTMLAYIMRYVYGRFSKMRAKKESGALSIQRQKIGLSRTVNYDKYDRGLDEEGFAT